MELLVSYANLCWLGISFIPSFFSCFLLLSLAVRSSASSQGWGHCSGLPLHPCSQQAVRVLDPALQSRVHSRVLRELCVSSPTVCSLPPVPPLWYVGNSATHSYVCIHSTFHIVCMHVYTTVCLLLSVSFHYAVRPCTYTSWV